MHLSTKRWLLNVKQRIFALDARVYAAIGAVLFFGIFGWVSQAQAGLLPTLDDATNWIFGLVGQILGIIIAFLGNLVLIMVSVLIAFASYNDFVKAQPVVIGWVLVRDIVNMFFIVILLISAFSTIIGYKHFHYKSILPKLLLMAVLVNFSRTLIGLMIDFSQVVMLTFVNAFQSAAGGNFISALKLNQFTKLDPDAPPDTTYALGSLVVASILGVVMLGIALTVIVIMAAFLVFRIVGLWILLILSPIAFFALALPEKMGKALTAFTRDFWSRLSTLLIGGPVMAFFLWLALAVVQGSDKPFGDTLATLQPKDTLNASFVTAIGNSASIGQFIVAVALLMAGLDFAMQTAREISPKLEKFAQAVRQGGGPAVHLARGMAQITKRTARVGAGAADRLFDVRGKVGRAGMAMAAAVPGAPGAERFARMAGARAREEAGIRGRMTESVSGLSAGQQLAFYRSRAKTPFNQREARAAQMNLATAATTGLGLKALTKEQEAKLTHVEDADTRKAMAEGLAMREAAGLNQAGKSAAEAMGDDEAVKKYSEAVSKNAGLSADWASLGGVAAGRTEDPRKYLETKKADSFKDSGAFLAQMKALGLVDDEGKFISTGATKDTWDHLRKGGGDRWAFISKHVADFENNPEAAKKQLAAMKTDATAAQIAEAETARSFVSKDSKGRPLSVNFNVPAAQVRVAPKPEVKDTAAVASQRRRLTELEQNKVKANSPEAVEVKKALMRAGDNLTSTFKFDGASGAFEDQDNRQAFDQVMKDLEADLAAGQESALQAVSRLDVKSLAAKPGAYNEARAAAVSAIKPETLQKAFESALEANNQAAQKNISQLIDLMAGEGQRVVGQAKKLNISVEDLAGVSAQPASEKSVQIIQRMEAGGMPEAKSAVDAAAKSWDIESDPRLRVLRSGVPARMAAAGRRAAEAAGHSIKDRAGAIKKGRERQREQRQAARAGRREEKMDKKVEKMMAQAEAKARPEAEKKKT